MFEASVKARQFDRGQTIEGTIVGFGPKVAFVSIGGKGEAEIDVAELKDDDGDVEVSVGDRIQAMVVSTSGGIVLSRKGVRNAATQRELEDAFRAGLAVEGKVEKVVRAATRCASPASARSVHSRRSTSSAPPTPRCTSGRPMRSGSSSTRTAARTWSSRGASSSKRNSARAPRPCASRSCPARCCTGRVASVLDFGAFVDLGGGIQGLLHVSEMSWSRVTTPGAVVAPGDQITVKVLRVDEGTEKISLGLKQLLDDPWSTVATTYEVGQVRSGRVTRVAEFGAFVELEPGIEGLAHASTFPPTGRAEAGRNPCPSGATAAFEILSIDLAQKRIGVALVEEGSLAAPLGATVELHGALAPGAIVTGKVERHEKFGVFVFLSPGRTGLMPFAETGVDRDADMAKAFPIGSEVEVGVLEVDAADRRIRLSRKAVARAARAGGAARVRRAGRTLHLRRRWDRWPTSCVALLGSAEGNLFVSERFDRIEVRSAPRRIKTEHQADGDRDEEGEQDRARGHDRRPAGEQANQP